MGNKNEAVLITAGTKRLGFYLARALLKAHYSLILHYRTTNTAACTWLQKNSGYQEKVFFIRQDLRDSPETLIDRAASMSCKLVGLVNNASVFTKGNLSDAAHLAEMVDIHVRIPARLGARFSELVHHGWIVNITDSMSGNISATYQNYRMSKLFLDELTRQQAFLYAPKIRVNAVAPGAVLAASGKRDHLFDNFKNQSPLQKNGSPKMVAEAVLFCAKNSHCTGQILAIDGGLHLNR